MILVTGATGFLGKRVCKKLDEMKRVHTKTSLSLGVDLRDEEQTLALFAQVKPDYVINCAAFIGGVQFGYDHAGEMFYNNLKMELSLLQACSKYKIMRLINPIGNCSYPGDAKIYRESDFWNGPLHESVKAYGFAKKALCIGSWAYSQQYGLDTINLILSNMYGPEDHFDEQRSHAVGALIMKFVTAREKNLPVVTVWGTGNPIREWLHVDDAADALFRAITIDPYPDIINIGVARGYSIKDTAQLIKLITGYTGEIVFDTTKIDGADCKTVDGALCERLMSFKPKIDFEIGLRQTVEWYENNAR